MFGRRADGRRLDNLDPIIQITPYIMKERNDAMNFVTEYLDFQPMSDYVKKRTKEGSKVSFMGLVTAAYVRTISKYPELNRFIMNKQIFARNDIVTSITIVKNPKTLEEELIKMHFSPDATLDEVEAEIQKQRDIAMNAPEGDGVAAFAKHLIKHRILVQAIVWFARFTDRYGLLPKFIYDISPFHCSMFLTNMASLNMPPVYHHLYKFGNVSVFIALGKYEKHVVRGKDGTAENKTMLPINFTIDERICGGAGFSLAVQHFINLLANPEQLEQRPAEVKLEIPNINYKK